MLSFADWEFLDITYTNEYVLKCIWYVVLSFTRQKLNDIKKIQKFCTRVISICSQVKDTRRHFDLPSANIKRKMSLPSRQSIDARKLLSNFKATLLWSWPTVFKKEANPNRVREKCVWALISNESSTRWDSVKSCKLPIEFFSVRCEPVVDKRKYKLAFIKS